MNILNLPDEVRPGDAVAADDFNKLVRALRSVQIQPGKGYQRRLNASGTTLTIKQGGRRDGVTEYAPFALRSIKEVTAGNYEVTLEPGRVKMATPVDAADTGPPAGSGYAYYVPEIGGVPMNEKDVDGKLPTIALVSGEMIFCQVERGPTGVVQGTVQMVVGDTGDNSDHYQPTDPAGSGHDSLHDKIRILEIEVVADELEVKVWRKSDIDLTPFLWTGENVGGGSRVFQEHDEQEGVYKFRSITGCWATEVTEQGETIQVEWEGENVGDGSLGSSGSFGQILIEKAEEDPGNPICGEAAKFKTILQGAVSTRKQIEIVNEDENVRIQGNGKNGSILWVDCEGEDVTLLTYRDGLVTSDGEAIITAGCSDGLPSGTSGQMLYHNGTNWVVLANPGAPGDATPTPFEYWQLEHNGTAPYWGGVI